jgi:hypothetical protein
MRGFVASHLFYYALTGLGVEWSHLLHRALPYADILQAFSLFHPIAKQKQCSIAGKALKYISVGQRPTSSVAPPHKSSVRAK